MEIRIIKKKEKKNKEGGAGGDLEYRAVAILDKHTNQIKSDHNHHNLIITLLLSLLITCLY